MQLRLLAACVGLLFALRHVDGESLTGVNTMEVCHFRRRPGHWLSFTLYFSKDATVVQSARFSACWCYFCTFD